MRPKSLLCCPKLSFRRSIPREIVMTDPARRDVPGHVLAPALPTRTGRRIAMTRDPEIPKVHQKGEKELAADLAARNLEILIQRSQLLKIERYFNLFKFTFWNPPQPGNRPTPAFYYDTCIFTVLF